MTELNSPTADTPTPRLLDAKWALRRALLGLFILTLGVGSVAWLTHASIDPALETSAISRAR